MRLASQQDVSFSLAAILVVAPSFAHFFSSQAATCTEPSHRKSSSASEVETEAEGLVAAWACDPTSPRGAACMQAVEFSLPA